MNLLRRDPLQSTVLSAIVAIHVIFILIILFAPPFAFRKKPHKPLIVKTVTLKTPAPKIASIEKKSSVSKVSASTPPPAAKAVSPAAVAPAPAPKKTIAPAPVAQPAPAAPVAKKVEKKITTPAPKKEPAIADKTLSKTKPKATPQTKTPPAPPPRAKISDSLIRELEESIAKIENKSDKGTASRRAPISSKATLAPIVLQIDMTDASSYSDAGEGDYTDLLVSHLHQHLSLPEFGEVKIQLSLQQDGTVGKIVVLKAESEKNKKYLESNLPRLRFPRFEGTYAKKKESTFILTFCNG